MANAAVLGWLGLRPPRRVRRLIARGRARPVLAAAAVGAGLSVIVLVVGLPFSIASEQRARDYGLSTQDWGSWTVDVLKSELIGAVLAGVGAMILVGLVRRFTRSWFALAAVAIVVVGAAFELLSPVLIDPLFNKFTVLPSGPVRSQVLGLARQAGVKVGQVYTIDASRRTTAENAYVTGLGASKRRGPGLVLPAAFAITLVSFALGSASNVLSRRVEASADAYALKLTRDPASLIAVQRQFVVQNVADPDPPGWGQLLFGTHPTAVERIGAALTWARTR